MKNIIKHKIKFLTGFFGAIIIMSSCKYQTIKDANYPDQLIYMPAATYNPYMINAVPAAVSVTPTPGYPTRFTVDTVNRKFNVLLAAYRSGVYLDGAFTVDVAINTDTINKLIAVGGTLPVGTILLPNDKYSIPATKQMDDGSYLAKFDLSVNLDYLLTNYPSQICAIAVGISSTARATNPKFATTLIVIDTKIMKPTASFTTAPSGTDPKTINFTNTSLYGMRFIWNFGDGSPARTTTTMVNEQVSHTYTSGNYTATLTVQGIADFANASVVTKAIVIP